MVVLSDIYIHQFCGVVLYTMLLKLLSILYSCYNQGLSPGKPPIWTHYCACSHSLPCVRWEEYSAHIADRAADSYNCIMSPHQAKPQISCCEVNPLDLLMVTLTHQQWRQSPISLCQFIIIIIESLQTS